MRVRDLKTTSNKEVNSTSILILIIKDALDDGNYRTVVQYWLTQDAAVTIQFFVNLVDCRHDARLGFLQQEKNKARKITRPLLDSSRSYLPWCPAHDVRAGGRNRDRMGKAAAETKTRRIAWACTPVMPYTRLWKLEKRRATPTAENARAIPKAIPSSPCASNCALSRFAACTHTVINASITNGSKTYKGKISRFHTFSALHMETD